MCVRVLVASGCMNLVTVTELLLLLQSAVLSVLGSLSTCGGITSATLDKLACAKLRLKTLVVS